MKQFQINFHKKSLSNSRDAQKAGSVRLQAFESQSKVGKRAPNAINATDATFSSSKLRVSSQHHSDNTSSDPNSNSKTQLSTLFNPSNLSPVLLPAPSGKPLPLLLSTLKKPTQPVSVLSSTLSQIHLILTNPANQHLLLAQIPAIIPCVFERIVSDNDGVRKGVADVLSALFANASLHLVHSPITA